LADDWAGRDETDAEGDEVEGGRVVVTFGGAPVPTIVTGDTSDTPFPIRASDVITVWRVVHVETDAMEEVDDDQRRAQGLLKQGVVLSVNADVMVVGELDPPLVQTPDSRPVPEQLGMLQGGRVERLAGEIITEVDATIVRAEAVRLPGNRVDSSSVKLVLTDATGRQPFRVGDVVQIRDDDDPSLLDDGAIDELVVQARALMVEREFSFSEDRAESGRATNAYADAFLVFQYDGAGQRRNDQLGPDRVTFELNSSPVRSAVDRTFGGRRHRTDPAFLVTHLLLAYQPDLGGDDDPFADNDPDAEDAVLGDTGTSASFGRRGKMGSGWLFVETIRDFVEEVGPEEPEAAFATLLRMTAAHETWHSLTTLGDHDSQTPNDPDLSSGQGVMSTPGSILSGEQPLRFSGEIDLVNLRDLIERYANRVP